MERDPLRFVWRHALGRHLAASGLLVLIAPLLWAAFDTVRTIVDDAILRAGAAGDAALLRFAISLPERVALEPLVLVPGLAVSRSVLPLAAGGALLVLVALVAGLMALIGVLRSGTGARAVAAIRRAVLDATLKARPATRDDARQAAALAGPDLAALAPALGGVWLTPLSAGAVALVSGAFIAVADARLALVTLACVIGVALIGARRIATAETAQDRRRTAGLAVQRIFGDLIRRLPAVRAHGAAAVERERIGGELAVQAGALARLELGHNGAAALTLAAPALSAAVLLAVALAFGLSPEPVSPGRLAAAVAAHLVALAAVGQLARWAAALATVRGLFEDLATVLGAMQARGGAQTGPALPGAGALTASGVAAIDPVSGARVAGLDLAIAFPAHVAVVGAPGSGGDILAALVGGELHPSAGILSFAGIDLASVDPQQRARRIAFAGGEPVLLAGSLRRNLAYGCPDPEGPELDARLVDAATIAGLDGFIHARGLAGTIDPKRDPKLAAALVDGRRAVRAALTAGGAERFVDPFDPARYNAHATIAENILFGVPLGDTFREANLPSNPFMRAILEAEGLTKPLADMGGAIARSLVEIFAGLPDDHPLFERFALFSAAERPFFEDLVARLGERRRGGADQVRDRERLIGLALRYNENRYRLGLLTPDLEARLLTARASFASMLPLSLQPAIEFYAPDRVTAAASIQDNLLFGRIANDLAGAEAEVRRVVREVLAQRGLDGEVVRIGLETRIDARGETLLSSEAAAIDLARCLVRRPDIVVVERALDGLTSAGAERLVARLRRGLVGRGLILVTPALSPEMDAPPFDLVLRFDRGQLVETADRRGAVANAQAETTMAVGR